MDKATTKEAIATVTNAVYEYLKPLGFKKKGQVFNRKDAQAIEAIGIQAGQGWMSGQVTINFGYWTTGMPIKGEKDLDSKSLFLQPMECPTTMRLGMITRDQDIWWTLEQPELTVPEIISELEKALPWFLEIKSDN